MIWKLGTFRNALALFPVRGEVTRAFELAREVPGTRVDTDGIVTGNVGALVACLVAAGQKVPDSLLSHGLMPGMALRNETALAPFQKLGASFVASRLKRGVFLNDDMGLGKTVQTIAALSSQDPSVAKVVLCPAFLRPQWAEEIRKWTAAFNGREASVQVLWPKSDKRSKKTVSAEAEWLVAFYLDVPRVQELVADRRYYMVVDEVHNLRTVGKQRYQALELASLDAHGRVGLTASELYNDPAGLWPMYNLVSPAHWGSRFAFMSRYLGAVLNEWGGIAPPEVVDGEGRFHLQHLEELTARRSLHTLRRVKQDVWSQLPFDAKVQVVWLDPLVGTRDELKTALMGGLVEMDGHLQRVAMSKVGPVVEQLQGDTAGGLASLTFTYLKAQANAIASVLPGALLVTGDSTVASKRLEKINSYVKLCAAQNRAPTVIATMDALSEGVNCQWAKVVNFAAIDATPDKMRQCLARSVRMGQTGVVPVRIFARRYTLDERLVELNRQKLAAQFKMAGRKEKDKADLDAAFSPPGLRESLAEMYQRFLKAEKSEG